MSKKKGLYALTIGAIIGFAAGIISAPKSGKETREAIKSETGKKISSMEDGLKTLYKTLSKDVKSLDSRTKKLSGKAKKDLQALKKKATAVKKKIKMILSDMRDGLADDADVNQVLREAEATERKIQRSKK